MMKYCKIFLIIFIFGLLISPLFHMNMGDKLKQENRTLAKFPKIRNDKKFNYDFGKDFETWLGDRFGGRKKLISSRFKALYKINGKIENDKAFMNPSTYIYLKKHIKSLKAPLITADIDKIHKNLVHLKKWCDKNKIKLYLLIIPTRENLVLPDSEYLPPRPDLLEGYISELSDLQTDILYPKDLYDNKKYDDYPFYHTDHHWTEFGAFLTYQVLANEIKKDFPKFHTCTEDEFDIFYKEKPTNGNFGNLFDRVYKPGYCCPQVGLSDKDCPTGHKYKYYDHKLKSELIVKKGIIPQSRITHFNKATNDLKVTLIGNSSNVFLMPFLPFSTKKVQMLRANNGEKNEMLYMGRFEERILDFKPDILILSVRDHFFHKLKELYNTP